jgi:hypothetical protein
MDETVVVIMTITTAAHRRSGFARRENCFGEIVLTNKKIQRPVDGVAAVLRVKIHVRSRHRPGICDRSVYSLDCAHAWTPAKDIEKDNAFV